MKKLALHWQILIGLALGIVWAVVASTLGLSDFNQKWIGPFGRIFINLLTMVAVPLVLVSIIHGITNLKDVSRLGKMGVKTIALYLISTMVAISFGLVLVNLIQPGARADEDILQRNRERFEQFVQGQSDTDAGLADRQAQADALKERGPLAFLEDFVPSNLFASLGDNKAMLQVIFFAIFFGIALLSVGSAKTKEVVGFFDGTTAVLIRMVELIMKGAPFFVFALMAGVIADLAGDDPAKVINIFASLSWYALTVFLALAFMVLVFYPVMISLLTKHGYASFIRGISPAQLLAFSTSSSAATLPVTMDCVRDNLGVSEETSSFVLPIGATINMDGTSTYIGIATVFLAQYHMVDLGLGANLTILLTATLASIGTAAIPSAGIVMMMVVLNSVGLNPSWVGIVLPVDRPLDMCRTTVNVTGDAAVATVLDQSNRPKKGTYSH